MLNKNYFFCGFVGTFFLFSFLWSDLPKSQVGVSNQSRAQQNISQKTLGGDDLGGARGDIGKNSQTAPASQKQTDFYPDPIVKSKQGSDSTFFFLLLRMILVVLAILFLAFLVLYFLKKRQNVDNAEQSLVRSLVHHRLSLSSNVQIVRVVQDYFMFVGGNDGVSYVQKIEDKQSIDEIKLFENQKVATAPRFFDDFFGAGAVMQGKGGSAFSGLPRALSVTKMMLEKMRKK